VSGTLSAHCINAFSALALVRIMCGVLHANDMMIEKKYSGVFRLALKRKKVPDTFS